MFFLFPPFLDIFVQVIVKKFGKVQFSCTRSENHQFISVLLSSDFPFVVVPSVISSGDEWFLGIWNCGWKESSRNMKKSCCNKMVELCSLQIFNAFGVDIFNPISRGTTSVVGYSKLEAGTPNKFYHLIEAILNHIFMPESSFMDWKNPQLISTEIYFELQRSVNEAPQDESHILWTRGPSLNFFSWNKPANGSAAKFFESSQFCVQNS